MWGHPPLDLMAPSLTKRLPLYVPSYLGRQVFTVDMMSVSQKGMDAHVFPPWDLIAVLLNRLKLEDCILMLIALCWPDRHWFPDLPSLFIDRPVGLPV